MKRKRWKRKDAALLILGIGAGVGIAAGITLALSRRKGLALNRELHALEKRVLRALRQDPTARAQDIDVAAIGAGVIELSGNVDDQETAREIVAVVDAVPGVHAVFNRLDVRSVEQRLHQNRTRREGSGTRWYGGTVGIGRRRQNPATDPARRDDHADLKLKALQPNRDEVLSEVEEMEGSGVEIGLSRPGPLRTDVPPGKPIA